MQKFLFFFHFFLYFCIKYWRKRPANQGGTFLIKGNHCNIQMRYEEFEDAFSSDRMSKYVTACNGDTRRSMMLYRCNLRLSQEHTKNKNTSQNICKIRILCLTLQRSFPAASDFQAVGCFHLRQREITHVFGSNHCGLSHFFQIFL